MCFAKRQESRGNLQSCDKNICQALRWKKFRHIDWSEAFMKMVISSATLIPERLSPTERAMFHAYWVYFQRVRHTHGEYPGSKRFEVEVRRYLFGANFDGLRTCPSWANGENRMQLLSDIEKSVQWKTVFMALQWA